MRPPKKMLTDLCQNSVMTAQNTNRDTTILFVLYRVDRLCSIFVACTALNITLCHL